MSLITQSKFGIATTDVNIRSGPGTSFPVLTVLRWGDQVTILQTQNGWHNVQYGAANGWVSSAYIAMSGDSRVGQHGFTTTELNIRYGPGTNYTAFAVLRVNNFVFVLEDLGAWLKVDTGHYVGYVSASYVKF